MFSATDGSLAITRSTIPVAPVEAGIFWREFVAALTVHLPGLLRHWIDASQNIGSMCYRLKMGGIYAGWIATEMVEGQARGDWANEQSVREAVRAILAKPPVSKFVFVSRPNPATFRLLDLRPESLLFCLREFWAKVDVHVPMPTKPSVVHKAEAAFMPRPIAISNRAGGFVHTDIIPHCHDLER